MVDARPNAAAAAAPEHIDAHERSLEFIRAQEENTDRKALEATRVFVSVIWFDLSAARTSTVGIEPLTFRPIVPVNVRRPKYDQVGMRIAEDLRGMVESGPEYTIFPGHLAGVIAGPSTPVVEVECLRGLNFERGGNGIQTIMALNRLCFPSSLRPETGPTWLDPFDPRHVNLFKNFKEHLGAIVAKHGKRSLEGGAANAALEGFKKGMSTILGHFGKLNNEANETGAPIPIDPKSMENIWLKQLGMGLPNWAVQFDMTGGTEPTASPEAQAMLAMAAELKADRESRDAARANEDILEHPAVKAALAAKDAQNAEMLRRIEALEKKK